MPTARIMEPQDERTLAAFCHLTALVWILLIPLSFLGLPIPPLLNLPGPLIVWLAARARSPFVDRHGRESLNYQISMTIYGLMITGVLLAIALALLLLGVAYSNQGEYESSITAVVIILTALGGGLLWVGVLSLLALWNLVLVITAAFRASNGRHYRYPLTIRLIPPPR